MTPNTLAVKDFLSKLKFCGMLDSAEISKFLVMHCCEVNEFLIAIMSPG